MFAGGRTSAKFDLVIDALGVQSKLAHAAPISPLACRRAWASLDAGGAGFNSTALSSAMNWRGKWSACCRLVAGALNRQAAFF
jgi:hypothetical protein